MSGTGGRDSAGANRFGYEWRRHPEILPLHERQFLEWVHPLQPGDFAGRTVLDAGCGNGRNSHWPLTYGAARVVAFDTDPRTVEVARRNLAADRRAEVLQASIYDIDFEDRFDIVFAIGVMHHLDRPREALRRLVAAAKPGGLVLIWVYGKEGATAIKAVVSRLRFLTCRLPPGLLHALTLPLAVPLYAAVRLLPGAHPYLRLLRGARFRHLHAILFDQLLPETANYWARGEVADLFRSLPVADLNLRLVNGISWTAWCRKADRPAGTSPGGAA